MIGDSGTGKTHLLIGLGTAAAEDGFRVRYTLATKLVNELVEAADERQLAKTIARYGRVDLLCIDELGYMELDRRGAEMLFQVLTEREEKNSVAIAVQRVVLRLDQDLHRSPALRRYLTILVECPRCTRSGPRAFLILVVDGLCCRVYDGIRVEGAAGRDALGHGVDDRPGRRAGRGSG